ncbi:MAG: hypothetical protein U1F44_07145 [Coriobacteriia bacterium]|nr:hypothetical protein [Coriobacteriia bacterium]
MRHLRAPRAAILACMIVTVLLLAGCATAHVDEHPAVAALTNLLELRRAGSADAEAYAPFFSNSALATELADSVGEERAPAVPPWDSMDVSSETSQGVEVLVVWSADAAFPNWAEATRFLMHAEGDRWIIDDALDSTADVPAPSDTVDH